MHTSESSCRLCSPAKLLPEVWLAVHIFAAAISWQQHCTFCVSRCADLHGSALSQKLDDLKCRSCVQSSNTIATYISSLRSAAAATSHGLTGRNTSKRQTQGDLPPLKTTSYCIVDLCCNIHLFGKLAVHSLC